MTLIPIYKTCLKCKIVYTWNPDVGRFGCPYCGGRGRRSSVLLDVIPRIKRKDKENESGTSKGGK